MHIRLKLTRPSAHWVGLANLIRSSDGLRSDITLVVDADGARFLDEKGSEILTSIPTAADALKGTETLAGKLRFLSLLHEQFPAPPPPAPAQSRLRRALPYFHKSGAINRAIRFSAAPSRR